MSLLTRNEKVPGSIPGGGPRHRNAPSWERLCQGQDQGCPGTLAHSFDLLSPHPQCAAALRHLLGCTQYGYLIIIKYDKIQG